MTIVMERWSACRRSSRRMALLAHGAAYSHSFIHPTIHLMYSRESKSTGRIDDEIGTSRWLAGWLVGWLLVAVVVW